MCRRKLQAVCQAKAAMGEVMDCCAPQTVQYPGDPAGAVQGFSRAGVPQCLTPQSLGRAPSPTPSPQPWRGLLLPLNQPPPSQRCGKHIFQLYKPTYSRVLGQGRHSETYQKHIKLCFLCKRRHKARGLRWKKPLPTHLSSRVSLQRGLKPNHRLRGGRQVKPRLPKDKFSKQTPQKAGKTQPQQLYFGATLPAAPLQQRQGRRGVWVPPLGRPMGWAGQGPGSSPEPLAAEAGHREHAPVDEDAKLRLVKPGGQRPGIQRAPGGLIARPPVTTRLPCGQQPGQAQQQAQQQGGAVG